MYTNHVLAQFAMLFGINTVAAKKISVHHPARNHTVLQRKYIV